MQLWLLIESRSEDTSSDKGNVRTQWELELEGNGKRMEKERVREKEWRRDWTRWSMLKYVSNEYIKEKTKKYDISSCCQLSWSQADHSNIPAILSQIQHLEWI